MKTSQFPAPNPLSLQRYYGMPWKVVSEDRIVPHPQFERENIVRVDVPFPLFFTGIKIRSVAVHKMLAESVKEILEDIKNEFSEKEMDFFGLNQYGGGYNFRPMRGQSSSDVKYLSLHAYGAALDFSPTLNPLGKKYNPAEKMIPLEMINIFTKRGWEWGGNFKHRPDCMHFQATK